MKTNIYKAACGCLMAAYVVATIAACSSKHAVETAPETTVESFIIPEKYDGIHVNVEYVVDTTWYGDHESEGVFYIVVDNPDQNLNFDAIRVDYYTYHAIQQAIESKRPLQGDLRAIVGYDGNVVYHINVEPEPMPIYLQPNLGN